MSMFKSVVYWKAVILKPSQKYKGQSKSLHVLLNKNSVLTFQGVSKWRNWSTYDVRNKYEACQRIF